MAMAQEASVDYEMSIRTVRLEKEYEKTLSDSARLLEGERDRVRRMEHLFLEFENEALRSQLDEANEHLLGFTNADSEACVQLEEACQEIDRLERHAQTSMSEIDRLREELASRKNTSTSYNAVFAEKVRLSKDLAALQTEVERLKAQSSSRQAMIAEKHEMERQLNSLEIQLDKERHAHERTRSNGSQQTAGMTKLSAQVDELRNELSGEVRAKQQQELDKRQQSSEFDSQRAVLEGKIDSLKQQLRWTKDKLQEAQNEVLQRRNNKVDRGDESEPGSRTIPLQRPGPSGHGGVTIATPGAVRVQEKVKKDSALPGDKSAFSITPFLNRTGAPADSPLSSVADEDDMREDADTTLDPLDKGTLIGQPKHIGSALRRQLSPTQDRNPISKPVRSKAHDAPATKNGSKKPESRLDRRKLSVDTDDEQLSQPEQIKPKKRKLGGPRDRSLMEEDNDDDEGEPRLNKKFGRKLALGAGRTSKLGGMQQPSTSNGERLQRGLGFGAPMGFSPLKRDRRRL
ncbi:hypothetical protein PENANT_c049G04740 [Penicillium antarcticum]|uniref:Uncharacterized protein n=1 Tax=Penicillium antarcticum TaxID=416450 RepID=A0A1V6PRL0_9EURO|nr:uncharacterized protein N7508_003742 [Penicillium antarcticum]KAJ5312912.1 hypothetical protein N7508_003742 [Penicillium antarcticum]OQD79541.1 hypothetical protein PENANT_c049G04740 [Penicillium antarcticum]